MSTFISRSAICAMIALCLLSCKKNNVEPEQQSARTTMEATCSDFSIEIYPYRDSTLFFKNAGFVIFDKETNQKYLLVMDVVGKIYANAHATINNPDVFADQTIVTKYSSQYLQLSPLVVPLQMTFQVKDSLPSDQLKSDFLGFKTIKVDIQPTAIYTMGIFGGPFDVYFSIDPYYNNRELLKYVSKEALGMLNDASLDEQGNQPASLDVELSKY
ncbi:MAG: hypothetical protein JSS98_09270 [Bacteroidetes bacterium]|nr:hypothetical protein [Bacteroidota bacterium]